jgi:quaternary ammonium compound-resistance protein SugE
MAWLYLFIAGLLEIVWAYFMKQSAGFTKPWPSIATIGFMIASFGLLSLAMRTLPLGTSYVVWTGIGAVGAFLVGAFVLHEATSLLRVLAALLIVSGIVLMKLTSPSE